jgi:tetratricopeptide (TPR) repeat protein
MFLFAVIPTPAVQLSHWQNSTAGLKQDLLPPETPMQLKYLILAPLLVGAITLPGLAQSQPPSPDLPAAIQDLSYDDYMSLGYNAQQEGRYSEAVQYFRNALYLNPDDRSAVVAYWNARDQLSVGEGSITFDQYMNRGYDATEAGNYPTALENFQNALALRPGNYYATQAIRNVQTYLNSDDLGLVNPEIGATPSNPAETTNLAPQGYLGETPYDRYMRLGYAAQQEEAFSTAANYFRSALFERPNDRWATIAYWNAIDGTNDGEAGLGSETEVESPYDRYMRLGYDATQREEYRTALDFFEQALELRPNDYYASEAIENVRTYLAN